jgi:3-oxoacyl-(acyl-carrier-protein) synthase
MPSSAGVAPASAGRGKGITALNLRAARAVETRLEAAVFPQHAGWIEGHGTSTKVGDVVEGTA